MEQRTHAAGQAAANRQSPGIGSVRRAVFHPELPEELRELFRDPEALADQVQTVKNSRSTTAGIFVVSGTRYFWKRSNVRAFSERFRRIGRRPRSEVNRLAAARLEALGIRTPKVWASVVTRSWWGLPGACYLITEGFPGRVTAAENLPALIADAGGVEQLAKRLTKMLFCLHEAGFEHGDLKLSNFLALPRSPEAGGGWELGLFDLDGAHWHRTCCSPKVRQRELARTASSMSIELKRWKIAAEYADSEVCGTLFAECYRAAGGSFYGNCAFYRKRLEVGWAQWRKKHTEQE